MPMNSRAELPEGIPRPRIISGVGEGWWPLVAEIHDRLWAIDPHYTVDQIKEKFGTLSYYFTASDGTDAKARQAMEAIVDEGEARSRKICEWCGKPARGPRGKAGTTWSWWLTLCDEHQAERDEGRS